MQRRTEIIIAIALLALIGYGLGLSVLASIQSSKTVSNAGTLKGVGVGIYEDSGCTTPLSSIDWGLLDPGSSANVSCYIRNEGNSALTLSMQTSNWSPADASTYLSLSWNYSGESLAPEAIIHVVFTLSVSPGVEGITDFSFDITVVGSD